LICDQATKGAITDVPGLAKAPQGLESFIKKWWEEVQDSADQPGVQCLLSYLTVALAPMTRAELVEIDPDDALGGFSFGPTLEKVERYIAGDAEDVGISFAHWRLKDFIARKVLSSAEVRKATDAVIRWCDQWREHECRYALAKGFAHRMALADAATGAQRSAHFRTLLELVGDGDYQTLRAEKMGDASGLVADMSSLCERLSTDAADDVAAVATIALQHVDARTRLLHPGVVFALAGTGAWEDAITRLELLPGSEFWRAAARMCIAWQVSMAPEARSLLDDEPPASQLLLRLAARVRAAFTGPEPMPPADPAAADRRALDEAARILERLSSREEMERGVEHASSIPTHADDAGGGLDQDSRTMVEAARLDPGEGGYYLQTYIGQIGANPYSDYRNRSLAFLLDEVSALPDPGQARQLATLIVQTAFQPSPLRFSEHLRLSCVRRMSERDTPAGETPPAVLRDDVRYAEAEAQQLLALDRSHRRGPRSDLWSFLRRRMAALAETLHAVVDGQVAAERLLDTAAEIESGFAGFRVPAFLALVEANVVVRPFDTEAQRNCLERARRAAHNIQDMSFCARSTAMVNRVERWVEDGPPAVDPLVDQVEKFLVAPVAAVTFGSLHIVGETFPGRSQQDHLPVDEVTFALTLEGLAHRVFQVPIAMMERANPAYGRADELPWGTPVVVPDSAFVPLVATWLGAQLMTASLPDAEKTRLLAGLVPITLSNPTALDTLLGRLVAVAPDVDLDDVMNVLPLARTFEPATSWVEYPGGYS
jgi:hypothetical protein